MSGDDAIEYMMAGASAVQVGTATFLNPNAPLDVLEGIESYMRTNDVECMRGIVGAALPSERNVEMSDAGRIPAERLHSGR